MAYWYLKHGRAKKTEQKIPYVGMELWPAHPICRNTNNYSMLLPFLTTRTILPYMPQRNSQLTYS